MKKDAEKKQILFMFSSVPYPLRADGVSLRYLPIIEYMDQRHELDLVIISRSAKNLSNLGGLKGYCREIFSLQDNYREPRNLFSKFLTHANFFLPYTPPLTVVAYNGSAITRGIVDAVKGKKYNVVVWVGDYLLPHMIDALPSFSVDRVVVDFVDSPYLWATRAMRTPSRFWPFEHYTRWKTFRWEREIIKKVDATIYVSRVDAEAIPSDMAPVGKRHVVPNGISIPDHSKMDCVSLPSPSIGFLGNMGYSPNVEAVEWLYNHVFTPLREIRPDLTLVVVGRSPKPSIRELGKKPGVIVTGTVEDVWAYIKAIDIFLFPLLRGAGLKNKILETMYAKRPVITTPIGNEGIDAIPGRDISICETPEGFQEETLNLLNSPESMDRMGNSAHSFVIKRFSWSGILKQYENLILGINDPTE